MQEIYRMRLIALNYNLRRLASSRTRFSATKSHLVTSFCFSLFLVISVFSFVEAALDNQNTFRESLNTPVEYCEVIYRLNAQSPKQLYIIGISHRDLLKRGYGITIIIPRTLADNRKLLQMTDIDRIVLADGNYPGQALQN